MGHLSKDDKAVIRRGAWCNDTGVPAHLRTTPDNHPLAWLDKIIEEQRKSAFASLLPAAIKAEEEFGVDECEAYARKERQNG